MPETNSIFDIVMPDWRERQQHFYKVVKAKTGLGFAYRHAKDVSPLFIFYAWYSWELIANANLIKEAKQWFRAASCKTSVELVYMVSWLLSIMDKDQDQERYEKLYDLLTKQIIQSVKLPKSTRRIIKLVDNRGVGVSPLELTKGIVIEEEGISRIGLPPKVYDHNTKSWVISQKDVAKHVAPITQRIRELTQKETLTEAERIEKNSLQHCVYKNKIRYDYPQTDKAAAAMRSNINKLKKMLDKKYSAISGSKILSECIETGRKCSWKGGTIQAKTENSLSGNELLQSWNNRRFRLKSAMLEMLSKNELALLNVISETGRQVSVFKIRYPHGPDPFQYSYDYLRKYCSSVGYVGENSRVYDYIHKGLQHYGLI